MLGAEVWRACVLPACCPHSLAGCATQEEGDAKPTAVVAEVADPHRDPGYWVGAQHSRLHAGVPQQLQAGGGVGCQRQQAHGCSQRPTTLGCGLLTAPYTCPTPWPHPTLAPAPPPPVQGTSRMLLEAALCLALQQEELAAAGLPRGGVLTPAAAMNSLLIERLRKAGVTYEVREVVRPQ